MVAAAAGMNRTEQPFFANAEAHRAAGRETNATMRNQVNLGRGLGGYADDLSADDGGRPTNRTNKTNMGLAEEFFVLRESKAGH